jgi:hypothetical protein
MNDPPTALVGFGSARDFPGSDIACRPNMNDPPTALVGFRKSVITITLTE